MSGDRTAVLHRLFPGTRKPCSHDRCRGLPTSRPGYDMPTGGRLLPTLGMVACGRRALNSVRGGHIWTTIHYNCYKGYCYTITKFSDPYIDHDPKLSREQTIRVEFSSALDSLPGSPGSTSDDPKVWASQGLSGFGLSHEGFRAFLY